MAQWVFLWSYEQAFQSLDQMNRTGISMIEHLIELAERDVRNKCEKTMSRLSCPEQKARRVATAGPFL
jgi:hypothetical protein